ncbi:MAG: hypothetical protein HY814_08385 [Candidatus Riflebacteria bacterium]|nr:hypothetical protein [Candidatus Riflebacteria bacterium]
MRRPTFYVDTSVFGGVFDPEFQVESRRFFDLARAGRFEVLVSPVLLGELAGAPLAVQQLLTSLPSALVRPVELTAEAIELRNAYLAAKIVGPRWEEDATHVALATLARADAIVSWNFKHLVRLDKIRLYNQVNLFHGFGLLAIVSPLEVQVDEDEP